MELKTPTKKGIKTPRYRPPLPMLNESCSGFCVDEYDWPQFCGYYNGTSVIVDDSQDMTLLTNKGFFGKGSLSKGCPNLAKRKIPINVVYESQWKRRKMWMQILNNMLESKRKSNETLEGNVVDIGNEGNNDAEKMEVDNVKTGALQNSSYKTNKNEGDLNRQNESNKTSHDTMVKVENKECDKVVKKDINSENNDPLENNSCIIEEAPSKTSENEDDEESKKNSKNIPEDSMSEFENKKSNEVDKKKIDVEKNSCLEIKSCKTEEELREKSMKENKEESENYSNETSQNNIVDIDNRKCNDVEKLVDNEENKTLNNSFKIEEGLTGNDSNEKSKVSSDTDIDMKEIIEKVEGQKEISDSDKIINIPIQNTRKENEQVDDNYGARKELTSNRAFDNRSKCVEKINLLNNKEKGTLNVNEVLVIPDIKGDLEQYFLNLKPSIEEEKVKTAVEVLYLSLEEAFFLSYSCNCLQIFDLTSNVLQIKDMWVLFQESQPDFIEKYVAYHYFRAKGWVVKSGTKFGGDFLLYKKGPLYFHASYIVIVEVLKDGNNSRNKTTWQKIAGMNRMAESANKEILICHVVWPDAEKEKFSHPGILKEFRVSEILLRRWQATHEKTP